jgi:adenylate cyclase
MTTAEQQRRLVAILAADLVGYSRLMGVDEAGTLVRLKAHRLEVIDPALAAHNGRLVKTTGDGLLIEFRSVIDAVQCAVNIQRRMAHRNADLPPDRQMLFRMGINLCDAIVDDGDVFGDDVNIAARLEALSEPGGICVSRAVRDQVGDRLDVAFEDRGEQALKNIARPVHVFRVALVPAQAPARVEAAAIHGPEGPSIAVLPFANMSGDPAQDFFADGMTEEIITQLSRFRGLFVISRNSVFVYRGKAVNVQAVARELGVQYVLEGSVRKAGTRVRITVQLIDAETDRHVWAERYDRDMEDLFALEDEVTSTIAATLPGRVEAATQDRVKRRPTSSMAAYEYVLAGKLHHHRSTKPDNAEALRLLDRAIALDPAYAHARAWKGCTLGQAWVRGWCVDRNAVVHQVEEEAQTALALDENDSDVHRLLAGKNMAFRDIDQAAFHQERALSLNPNDDLIVVQQGELLTWLGRGEEGAEWIRKAMRLNPYHPERYWNHLGRALYVARRYQEAIEAIRRISRPDLMHLAFLAACHAQSGAIAQAQACAAELVKREPAFSVAAYIATLPYKHDSDR